MRESERREQVLKESVLKESVLKESVLKELVLKELVLKESVLRESVFKGVCTLCPDLSRQLFLWSCIKTAEFTVKSDWISRELMSKFRPVKIPASQNSGQN